MGIRISERTTATEKTPGDVKFDAYLAAVDRANKLIMARDPGADQAIAEMQAAAKAAGLG